MKGFTKDGDIKLANGWVVSKDYGNLTHGYCITSYSSQSKGVDCVFVAESSESFRAADREQFYVSASRFKEALTIYTDDKRELLEAVSKSSHRPLATDLRPGSPTAPVMVSVRKDRQGQSMRLLLPRLRRFTRLPMAQRLAQAVADVRRRLKLEPTEVVATKLESTETLKQAEKISSVTPETPRVRPCIKTTVPPPRQSSGIRM